MVRVKAAKRRAQRGVALTRAIAPAQSRIGASGSSDQDTAFRPKRSLTLLAHEGRGLPDPAAIHDVVILPCKMTTWLHGSGGGVLIVCAVSATLRQVPGRRERVVGGKAAERRAQRGQP
jgi:hypothetical protein